MGYVGDQGGWRRYLYPSCACALFDYLVPVSLEDNFTQPHGRTLHVVSPMMSLLWSNQTLSHISSIYIIIYQVYPV